jgi:hypothetical protein
MCGSKQIHFHAPAIALYMLFARILVSWRRARRCVSLETFVQLPSFSFESSSSRNFRL